MLCRNKSESKICKHLEQYANIWNPVHLDRIRQNSTYWYVLVRTSTYWYMSVHDLHTSTYWYVPVRTLNKTCGFLIHPGSSLRVKYNSVQLVCKRQDSMMSNFKKCKVQVNQVHIGTYWYVLVRTGTYMYRHQPQKRFNGITLYPLFYANGSPLYACQVDLFLPTGLHCTLDLFFFRAVSSTV